MLRRRRLLHIYAQKHVHMIARVRLLHLVDFIGDLRALALEGSVDRALGIIHFVKETIRGRPWMPSVLCAAEHLAELRPLIVYGMLYERCDGCMEADETVPFRDEAHQRFLQLGIIEQYALRVVEANGIELADLIRAEHLDIVAEDDFVRTRAFAHLLDRIVAGRNRRMAADQTIADLGQVRDQHAAPLLRFRRRLRWKGSLNLLFLF